jgi:hypothetical protein
LEVDLGGEFEGRLIAFGGESRGNPLKVIVKTVTTPQKFDKTVD